MVAELNNFIKSNMFKRAFTSIILLSILYYCIIQSGIYIKSLILIVSFFLASEWYNITQKKKNSGKFLFFNLVIIVNLLFSFFVDFSTSIIITIIFSLFYSINIFLNKKINNDFLWLLIGFIYICLPLIIFINIENNTLESNFIILWFLITVLSTDIFSYIYGNLIKGPKILKNISPSKTYSGTILGILSGTFFGSLYYFSNFNNENIYQIIFFSLLISSSSFIGDLFISKIKRNFKVKDSGYILPGHGGFLDRYDSISISIMILFFLVYFI